tara:strand:+ start:155 stop:583 length:429 start_codon:yes stop_codon:yes gene_type:complete
MLDHYSNFPSPKGQEAAIEIIDRIYKSSSKISIKTKYDKKMLEKHVLSFVISNPPQCSFTGWIMGELNEYVNNCISTYKKILVRRKLKGIIKSIVYINLIYKESIEKYYAPNGLFETEMSNYWNPLLRDNLLWPPPPPENHK